jgi:hypothetical protein
MKVTGHVALIGEKQYRQYFGRESFCKLTA